MTSWTLILSELEADEETIVALRRRLLDELSQLGYEARTVTVRSFIYRDNVKPPEPFRTSRQEYQGPQAQRRPKRRNRGSSEGS